MQWEWEPELQPVDASSGSLNFQARGREQVVCALKSQRSPR
jgi:hypothetical protein